ncbi:DEKNAAC105579 [Brettanomyces naardenensis]|uniref:Ribose-phosphate pyrophosphokinase 1 n=1 Tax=Brettanomyces naardenensis TaxID=13370 RepID=A0A448YU23_BRENA|nr:DEKNAAC105579 [Brettanomyces naardenensis]
MRKCKVFVGNSHPKLGKLVCERLGIEPAPVTLKKFANGETSVQIGVSVRDEDVYIIQSGSPETNDHIMELLILISACKGGSAAKITAVIPSFPYAKQSKMKKHRGAITARMLANLLIMAGADHVVSMDLHASQMQGFFSKPVDNLYAGPTLARWIRHNIEDYQDAVVVSKNPGGAKRVTSLADQLKINFAMIHTDRERNKESYGHSRQHQQSVVSTLEEDGQVEEEDVICSSDLQTARIVKGHVLDEEASEEAAQAFAAKFAKPVRSPKTSVTGQKSSDAAFAQKESEINYDNNNSDDEDEPEFNASEKVITLVGNVQNRAAIIVDDMIDKHAAFIAAAEHLRKNCGAKKCYIVATHGIFSNDCLERLNSCPYIDGIIVTNTYPIPEEQVQKCTKLTVIDVSPIFAECIRRDHFGESISVLFDSLASVV